MRFSNKWLFIILLAVIFLIRIPHIENSPYEVGESWRQADTESMARNFVEERFNIFFPQLNYDGPSPNYAQLEFQVTTFLIAILYKLFGYHYELARLIPILFFTFSACYLYLITKKYNSTEVALLTTLLYGVFPLNWFFSRAIMPESAVLFFSLGALYYFISWIEQGKAKTLIMATVMTALAILLKIPAIFIGIPMLWMSIVKYKSKIFLNWQLWLFAIFALGLPFVYFKWLETVAEFKFVTGISSKHIIPEFVTAVFTKESLQFFSTHLPQSFTWIGLILAVIGMFMLKWKSEYPIVVWVLAIVLEVITIVAVIQFNYYLILIGPVLAILAGKALGSIWKWRFGSIFVIGVLAIIIFNSYSTIQPKVIEKDNLLKQAEYVKKYTSKEDLIVIGTFSPELINASERKGWRANINYYDYIPQEPKEEIEYFISHGAKYFVPIKGYIYGDGDNAYRKYLDDHFIKVQVAEDPAYSFYLLKEK
ncbi:ArnT family glycosyltransferase [Ureibacillus aquaedulcis]|uniref:Glycosyltransferase family 39 protein n=1 Tax=Ureibacillus aquaedulcis TaxID=3058421 RepID=A0ABT8GM88_9BACL|nr:glycosyltransferase family 39 protein [Ureibacillus sp. BA0131]MDN4492522.1 glycosyltransferase family 39 protein [Ureibacillus sp. BA0131]